MKRFILWVLDRRAQLRVFFAEAQHDSAVRVLREGELELARARELEQHTKGLLSSVKRDAWLASQQVRRYEQRAAVGLR